MKDLVNPITVTNTIIYTKYYISEIKVNLNISATINLILFKDDGSKHPISFEMIGTDYENWGSDDSYVENFIENKLSELYPYMSVYS